ncbi:MAG: PhzF family phenazine biosynthesis protein [Thermostichales cyanobacterium SRBZ-1_bins_19]
MAAPLTLYQVDAFTDQLFGGNPAAVVPLDDWLPDPLLQAIARENNLSETAFFLNRDPGQGSLPLRWFSPSREVPLCGHATLASAYVILSLLYPSQDQVTFATLSGPLEIRKIAPGTLAMVFPRFEIYPWDPPAELLATLPACPQAAFTTSGDANYYLVYDHAHLVRTHPPTPTTLVITAPGDADSHSDIVCRYFAPSLGIPEDPVTGSIQCGLTPYWATRLQQNRLTCRQLSPRQGYLTTHLHPHHIEIHGQAILYLSGQLHL